MSRELQKILAFYSCLCYYLKVAFGRSDGMADVTDSKSVGGNTVGVRVPSAA
jgi:hypothetical protein